jgi:hypothetical protein
MLATSKQRMTMTFEAPVDTPSHASDMRDDIAHTKEIHLMPHAHTSFDTEFEFQIHPSTFFSITIITHHLKNGSSRKLYCDKKQQEARRGE